MKHLSFTEIKSLLRQIPNKRQRVAVLVGFWHGLRSSEIISLAGAKLRYEHVDVKRLKGSMHTVQRWQEHPDPELNEAAMLREIVPTLKDDELLIKMTRSGLLKLVKRAAGRAGINPLKAHTHTLKHSCAMAVIGSGIENARQRLGHKSLSSTGAYLRVSDDSASDAINGYLGIG